MNILITGGGSGLGEAITRKLASIPGNVVFFTVFQSLEGAARIEKEFPGTKAIPCDFTNSSDLERLLTMIADLDLDILVNNALTGMTNRHFHKIEPDTFLSSFKFNVLPTLRITQQAIVGFRKKKCGKIITVLTSYLINRPPTGLSEYVANKAYLESLTKSWAGENAKYDITSNSVSPSMMRTELTSALDERVIEEMAAAQPLGKLVTPAEVADTIAFLADSTQHINGVNLVINGGVNVV